MEVEAQKCRKEIPSKGGELCDRNECSRVCKSQHGALADGRCLEVDACYCEYAGPCH
ncbi:hypothetical protein ACS0TY_005865 [Phlomoides rotata]